MLKHWLLGCCVMTAGVVVAQPTGGSAQPKQHESSPLGTPQGGENEKWGRTSPNVPPRHLPPPPALHPDVRSPGARIETTSIMGSFYVGNTYIYPYRYYRPYYPADRACPYYYGPNAYAPYPYYNYYSW